MSNRSSFETDGLVAGCLVGLGVIALNVVVYGATLAFVVWVVVHVLRALGVIH